MFQTCFVGRIPESGLPANVEEIITELIGNKVGNFQIRPNKEVVGRIFV